MDLFDELKSWERDRESRPLPPHSEHLPRYLYILPDASDLGSGWTNVSTRISDERFMRRNQSVYASRRYLCDNIIPFVQDGEQFSLDITVYILPSPDDALAEIGHIAIEADEMKAVEQWDHALYGTIWENCIAYPRDPSDFNDMIVAFPYENALWRIQSRGPHALRFAHFVHTQVIEAPIPKRE
jgi:hypothetical protein